MKRRLLLGVAPFLVMGGLGHVRSSRADARPGYTISEGQLQRMVAARFPARYTAGGMIELEVQAPQLRLLPQLNRVAAELALQAAGAALRRSYQGSFVVDFALRYESTDQSIRAHELRVHSLHLPGLPPRTLRLLDAYSQALAEQALLEVVLHRLRPRDLALADAMGLQPGDITVTSAGLVIGFVAKQAVK